MIRLPRNYIFDIDGTLADPTHRLHHILEGERNWDAFYEELINDPIILPVANIMHSLIGAGYGIIFITGRNEVCLEDTRKWIETVLGVNCYSLFMRRNNDRRPDYIIKKDIYESWPDELKNSIQGVFEDRNQVVDMWRELGLICLQVQEGDY